MSSTISKETLQFLKALQANNNRDWFAAQKTTFKQHETEAKRFFKSIQTGLEANDDIEGHKVYRIYNDVRFSANKLPYKARFAGSFTRATKALRGGYYLNIEPGNSLVGGGFYAPNKEDLLRIRQEFEHEDTEIRSILHNKKFQQTFGTFVGSEVKSAPRGFDPNHPAIDLIKKQQFIVIKNFTDKEVLQKDFADKVLETYATLRPFFDYMSSVLTTDTNGESLID